VSDHRTESDLQSAVAPGLLDGLRSQLHALDQSGVQFPAALTIPAPNLDPWQWLNANRGLVRIAWADRDGNDQVAGLGAATVIELEHGNAVSASMARCQALLAGNSDLRFFGGCSFDGTSGWEAFGAGRFVLPRLSLSEGVLTLAVLDADDAQQAKLDLQSICFEPAALTHGMPHGMPNHTEINYSPTFDGWQSRVDEALSLIRSEVIEKIVLSRKAQFTFTDQLCPIALTERLKAATHDCFVFCFEFEQGNAFVGATPERLFLRRGHSLKSEVIAGTRMRGSDSVEDEHLAIELLTSDKEQREHDIVRKSIRQKLHKFVDHLSVDTQASVLRLAYKQHLRSNVQGTLKADVDDGMLLDRLHPTPAVGGYPTDNALPEISRMEPFNRGWYAGPVGWIGADSAQFAVGIRSGLVEGDTLSLFSGAGIVRGSDPAAEWQEVENKIQDFISILRR
jgi:menaquinone-specific isochorismate synthase